VGVRGKLKQHGILRRYAAHAADGAGAGALCAGASQECDPRVCGDEAVHLSQEASGAL
jgi:hypothetical protein